MQNWVKITSVVLSFAILFGWSLFKVRNQKKGFAHFVLGGRNIGAFASAFTSAAASANAGMFVGAAGIAYLYGWGGATWQIGGMLGLLLTWLLIAPKIRQVSHRMKALTIPELFAKRYQSKLFYPFVSFWIVFFSIPILIVQLKAVGFVLEIYFNIPFEQIVIVFTVLMILFLIVGGFRGLALISTIHGFVLVATITAALIFGLIAVNGLSGLDLLLTKQDTNLVSFFGQMPKDTWINLFFIYLFGMCCMPNVLPTFYAMKNSSIPRKAFPIAMTVTIYGLITSIIIGLIPRALNYTITNSDQAYIIFANSIAPPVVGLFLVLTLLVSAFIGMITLLMSSGTCIINDIGGFLAELSNKYFLENKKLIYTKIAIIVIGFIACALSMIDMPIIVLITAFGHGAFIIFIGIPLVFGLYWKKSNSQSALFCVVGGPLIYLLWKYLLVKPTGIHELVGSMIICILVTVIWSILRPNYRAS